MPIALITGIAGQDGSYLAQLLLAKGYRVAGLVRREDRKGDAALCVLAVEGGRSSFLASGALFLDP